MEITALSTSMNYAVGRKADENGVDLAEEDEFDITLDYRPTSTRLKGLWIRLRYAEANRGGQNARDFRAIINYDINLL